VDAIFEGQLNLERASFGVRRGGRRQIGGRWDLIHGEMAR